MLTTLSALRVLALSRPVEAEASYRGALRLQPISPKLTTTLVLRCVR